MEAAQAAPVVAASQPPFTVRQTLVICGMDDATQIRGETAAQRIAMSMFDEDYETCIEKTLAELESDFKDYSSLTVIAGQLRFDPGTKRNVKAFMYWCKDKYRKDEDPTMKIFPVADAMAIIRKAKTHKAYMDKSKTISDTATPSQFTDKVRCIDWLPTLI